MLCPDVSLSEDRSEIGSPSVSSPSQDLQKETPIGLHSGKQFSLFADLDVGVPTVRHHPSGEELVIARVKVIFAKPEVISETMKEIGILEDDSTVGSRSTRKTRDTTVNVCRGGNFNVSNGQSKRGKNFPNSHP